MSECPIENNCEAKKPDCEADLCELGEHLADWGILCDDCQLYNDSCDGMYGEIEEINNCTMNTAEMRTARAIKEIFEDESPQDICKWTGVSLDKAIRLCSLLIVME